MPLVHIKTNRLEYKFEINGKYTLIKGNSATGKTTFYDLVLAMNSNPAAVQNLSAAKVIAVPAVFENFRVEQFSNCILVIDEDCTLFNRKDAASIFMGSNNYFIIINRSLKINYLPVHVDNVFAIKSSGKFHTLERIYHRYSLENMCVPEVIITEDSRSGFLFLRDFLTKYLKKNDILITPAVESDVERGDISKKNAGASKISTSIQAYAKKGVKHILVVYDAAAFAPFIDVLQNVIKQLSYMSINVLDWDSFEAYVLNSPMLGKTLQPKDADCSYESFEQFATLELQKILPRNANKNHLSFCLKVERCTGQCPYISECTLKRKHYSELIYDGLKYFEEKVKG